MGADDQVLVLDHEITNRRRRHVQPQRLPLVTIVKRHRDVQFTGSEQQTPSYRILTHGINRRAVRQAGDDAAPAAAAVTGAVDVRAEVVESQCVHRDVGRVGVEV